LKGHTNIILSLAFHHDGKILISGGLDLVIMIWDAVKGEKLGK